MFHALDVAQTQVGVVESTGRNDGVPDERYGRGLGRGAWCALFVMFCFESSDDPNPHRTEREWWRYGAVKNFEAGMKSKGLWLGWRVRPSPNDIIFFGDRGSSDNGRGRHMGIVERVADGYVLTVEGNLSNGVRRTRHRLSSSRVTGYARTTPPPFGA